MLNYLSFMDRKNLYSSTIIVLLLIASIVSLGISVYNQKHQNNKADNNTATTISSLKLTDPVSKNVTISGSKFSTSVTNSYNPTNASTDSLQSNSSIPNNDSQSLQNAALSSSVDFPIN